MKPLPLLLSLLLLACATPRALRPPEGTDWRARLGGLRTKQGKPLLARRDIDRLQLAGAHYADVATLLAMHRPDGPPVFDGPSLVWYLEQRGTPDYARHLLGRPGYRFTGYQIAALWARDCTTDWVDALTGGNAGTPWFTPQELPDYADAGGTADYAAQASRALGGYSADLSGRHLVRLLRLGVSPYQLRLYAVLRNNGDGPLFGRTEHLVRYLEAGGTLGYADSLRCFDGRSLYRFRQLGLSAAEALSFTDSPRPNAVVLFARADYNDEFENAASLRLFRAVHREYDVYVRLIGGEEEVDPALRAVPDVELLWIAGHGWKGSILLNDGDDPYDETQLLDTTDAELAGTLATLASDATVFLDACYTDAPRDGMVNLADYVRSLAPGRTVVAADYLFTHDDVVVRSLAPLRLEFRRRD